MRHLLLPASVVILWIANLAYLVAVPIWPHVDKYDSGQRLLVGVAIAVTIAWLIKRQGIEYKIGYRHGRKDQKK